MWLVEAAARVQVRGFMFHFLGVLEAEEEHIIVLEHLELAAQEDFLVAVVVVAQDPCRRLQVPLLVLVAQEL